MKKCFLLFALSLIGCQPKAVTPATPTSEVKEISESMVRVNSTLQSWNIAQPWEKNPARQRRSLAAIVEQNQVITTAEMVADATLIEVESTDGAKRARATVACVDYEANLALLKIDDAKESADFFLGKHHSPWPIIPHWAIRSMSFKSKKMDTACSLADRFAQQMCARPFFPANRS